MTYDVIVIGAGISGAIISRQLSRYNLSVCLIEKEADVAVGTSKANSAVVHAGFDAEPGSLKAMLNVKGNKMMDQIVSELDVPFKRIGSLVLAFEDNEIRHLLERKHRGEANGVDGLKMLSRDELLAKEPNVNPKAVAALYAPTAGIVCPYELTIGAVENAVHNGVELMLETAVNSIRIENDAFIVSTDNKDFMCKYVVNAAGLYADRIAETIGDNSFGIHPRKGEYILFDKNHGKLVNSIVFQVPTERGKGILLTPTVDGNLLIGPNAEDTDDKEDTATTAAGLESVIAGARKSVPGFNMKDAITSFSGLRAVPSCKDFIIGASAVSSRFINVAGIESPGLTAAPGIGEYVVEALKRSGLKLEEKTGYSPYRKRIVRFSELDEKQLHDIIKMNPAYGRIVCRCEKVSEGEIVDCIKRPAGAGNLDAVKRRTRAGMGRCQGGFCTPRVVEILARELGIPMEEVTKKGGASRMLAGKTK